MKKYFNLVIGSLIIALSYSFIFLPYKIVSNGIFGIGELLNFKFNCEPSIFILIFNLFFLTISYIISGTKGAKRYLIPSILIPIFIYIFDQYNNIQIMEQMETIIAVITGAFLTGYGNNMIYKEGYRIGGLEIIQDLIHGIQKVRNRIFTYIVEAIILIMTFITLDFNFMVYSAITVFMIHYLATKSKIGVSSSKTFFIITEKEKEVKNYIINDLNYDYTEFSVKGGYSNQKSKIIMSVIDTKDYYRIREGISIIDPNAFISIIDTYESLNKNVTLKKEKQLKWHYFVIFLIQ